MSEQTIFQELMTEWVNSYSDTKKIIISKMVAPLVSMGCVPLNPVTFPKELVDIIEKDLRNYSSDKD